MLIKNNNIRDNALPFVRYKASLQQNIFISILTRVLLVSNPNCDCMPRISKNQSIQDSCDSCPFQTKSSGRPVFPLKSRSLTFPRRPSIVIVNVTRQTIILPHSLSMNERLDNVLARICNWNPREGKERYESQLCISEMGIR